MKNATAAGNSEATVILYAVVSGVSLFVTTFAYWSYLAYERLNPQKLYGVFSLGSFFVLSFLFPLRIFILTRKMIVTVNECAVIMLIEDTAFYICILSFAVAIIEKLNYLIDRTRKRHPRILSVAIFIIIWLLASSLSIGSVISYTKRGLRLDATCHLHLDRSWSDMLMTHTITLAIFFVLICLCVGTKAHSIPRDDLGGFMDGFVCLLIFFMISYFPSIMAKGIMDAIKMDINNITKLELFLESLLLSKLVYFPIMIFVIVSSDWRAVLKASILCKRMDVWTEEKSSGFVKMQDIVGVDDV